VHGRCTSRRTVEPDGTVRTGLIERPRAQWPVLIQDHHEGCLSWGDYLANETKLAANRTNAGARPPREGSALCQGIITCGSCGKPMRTNYRSDQKPSYECSRRADRLTTSTCRSIAAATVDTAVASRLLQALDPAEIALALAAADDVTDRHQRISRAAELAVERARYEADRERAGQIPAAGEHLIDLCVQPLARRYPLRHGRGLLPRDLVVFERNLRPYLLHRP
jgi:hypothetical protein